MGNMDQDWEESVTNFIRKELIFWRTAQWTVTCY